MKYSLALIFLFCGVSGAETFIKNTDGVKVFGKWRCIKNGYVAYSDAERDAYITKASKASSTITTSDFTDIYPTQTEIDEVVVKSKTLEERIVDLEAKIKILEAK